MDWGSFRIGVLVLYFAVNLEQFDCYGHVGHEGEDQCDPCKQSGVDECDIDKMTIPAIDSAPTKQKQEDNAFASRAGAIHVDTSKIVFLLQGERSLED